MWIWLEEHANMRSPCLFSEVGAHEEDSFVKG